MGLKNVYRFSLSFIKNFAMVSSLSWELTCFLLLFAHNYAIIMSKKESIMPHIMPVEDADGGGKR